MRLGNEKGLSSPSFFVRYSHSKNLSCLNIWSLGDYDGRTALHLAAGEGHSEIVEELCARGANVNAEDRWGGRPTDDAVRCGYSMCAGILDQYGGTAGRLRSTSASSIQSRPQPDGDSFHENDDGDECSNSSPVSMHGMEDEKATVTGRTAGKVGPDDQST